MARSIWTGCRTCARCRIWRNGIASRRRRLRRKNKPANARNLSRSYTRPARHQVSRAGRSLRRIRELVGNLAGQLCLLEGLGQQIVFGNLALFLGLHLGERRIELIVLVLKLPDTSRKLADLRLIVLMVSLRLLVP